MDGATGGDSTSRFQTDPHVADQEHATQHQETMYPCRICFETATQPVASICGHLFCWRCLFAWLGGHPRPCPVCRTNLIQGVNIIPLFTFTGGDVDECPTGEEPQSNTSNATMIPQLIPQRPPPPSPDRIPRPIPLPSPVAAGINTENPRVLEVIVVDPTDNSEISVYAVEDLVQMRQENERNIQQIDLMNSRHAEEIAAIHRQYEAEIRRIITLENLTQWRE